MTVHGEILVSLPSNDKCSIDPWLIVGLAAFYEHEYHMFDKAGMNTMADQMDYMLTALQEIAGLALHNDKNYFTFGEGNEEYLNNTETA